MAGEKGSRTGEKGSRTGEKGSRTGEKGSRRGISAERPGRLPSHMAHPGAGHAQVSSYRGARVVEPLVLL